MPSLLKSTALGLGLLAGVAAPPAVTSSTQSILPKPGGQAPFEEGHYQAPADWNSNMNYHPYSTSIGPKPGSHSSGQDEHYQATEQDNTPARRPYTSTGTGPRPN